MQIALHEMGPRPDRVRQSRPDLFGNDPQSFRSDFTERRPGVPQLLLVEQPVPGSTVLAHYHSQDQFQVFMDGTGKLGRHEVGPVTLHYTNRYTGYGPIVAGEHGLSYYVLRPSFDTLGTGQYLVSPQMRDKLKQHPGPKRSVVAEPIVPLAADELLATPAPQVRRLLEGADAPAERGMFADLVRLGPGQSHEGPPPASRQRAGGHGDRRHGRTWRGAVACALGPRHHARRTGAAPARRTRRRPGPAAAVSATTPEGA